MLYTLRFFLSLQNAVCFIMLTCLVPVLFTFYIQNVLTLKKEFRRQRVNAPRSAVLESALLIIKGAWGVALRRWAVVPDVSKDHKDLLLIDL